MSDFRSRAEFSIANSSRHIHLGRMLIDHTRLSQTFYGAASAHETALVRTAQNQHDAMIPAIEVRDTPQVTDLTLKHWDLSKDWMERFVRPDPLPLDVAQLERTRDNAVRRHLHSAGNALSGRFHRERVRARSHRRASDRRGRARGSSSQGPPANTMPGRRGRESG